MKKLFNQKLLLIALSAFVLSACSDDERIRTKGEFTLADGTTAIGSGIFAYNTNPQYDADENEYYRNQLIFLGKGLKIVSADGEYEITGEGNMLELFVNNEGQELEDGGYTWPVDENEQAFDLRGGLLTLNVNTDEEEEYALYSGSVMVTKSGSVYKITFTGTAYFQFSGSRGLPPLDVTAEFEGQLKTFGFDF
jgi:hypothetical protein